MLHFLILFEFIHLDKNHLGALGNNIISFTGDCNTLKTTVIRRVLGASNIPTGAEAAGVLLVLGINDFTVQMYIAWNCSSFHVRTWTRNENEWNIWKQIPLT